MDDFVNAVEVNDEVEAGLLDALLTEEAIPHIMRSYYDVIYDGIFQAQKGWGCVQAPSAHHARIQEILMELRASAKEDDGAPEEAES